MRQPRDARKRDQSCREYRGRSAVRRSGKIQAGRLEGESGPMMQTQIGRPGDPATRRPGDPATRRPGDPATRRPGDPATRRPGDPATRRPGDPATRRPGDPATRRPGDPATRRPGDPATIIAPASSAIVKSPAERTSLALRFRPRASRSVAAVAQSACLAESIMVMSSPPNLSPGLPRETRTPAKHRLFLSTCSPATTETQGGRARSPFTRTGGRRGTPAGAPGSTAPMPARDRASPSSGTCGRSARSASIPASPLGPPRRPRPRRRSCRPRASGVSGESVEDRIDSPRAASLGPSTDTGRDRPALQSGRFPYGSHRSRCQNPQVSEHAAARTRSSRSRGVTGVPDLRILGLTVLATHHMTLVDSHMPHCGRSPASTQRSKKVQGSRCRVAPCSVGI